MEQLANNPVTTLSGNILSGATTLGVTSGTAFPSSGDFTVKIGTELIRVTGVSGTTWTIARGQESTTAASHSSGDTVTQVVTTNVVSRLLTEMIQVGGYSSRPATARAGTEYVASDLGNVSWKHDGTNWNLNKPLYVPYANRVDVSGWTALNATGLTWDDRNGVNYPTCAGTSNNHIRGAYHALPSAPFTATLICGRYAFTQLHIAGGIILYDSGTSKVKFVIADGFDNGNRFIAENWTDPDNFSAALAGTDMLWVPHEWYYLRFEDDNTNWIYSFSLDGVTWVKYYSETRNSFLTPDKIGIGLYKQSDHFGTTVAPFHFFGYWEA